MTNKIAFSSKLSRLGTRLRSSEWRQYATLLLTGKLAGVCLLLMAAFLIDPGLMGLNTYAADPVLMWKRYCKSGEYSSGRW